MCIGTEPYPATLGQRVPQEGGWLQEVIVEAPSGLTYRLFFEEDTCLIARLEYVERTQYAESEEVLSIVTHVDSYRTVDGVLVADRLRLFSRGTLKAEVRLVEYELNVGLSAGFFSMDRLRQDLARNPVKSGEVRPAGKVEEEWKGSAYRKIVERLQTHGNCRFREVASYGDPKRYHERIFGSGLVLVIDPQYLEADDVLAFYAELLAAPSGFYEDCIVLAAPQRVPPSPATCSCTKRPTPSSVEGRRRRRSRSRTTNISLITRAAFSESGTCSNCLNESRSTGSERQSPKSQKRPRVSGEPSGEICSRTADKTG